MVATDKDNKRSYYNVLFLIPEEWKPVIKLKPPEEIKPEEEMSAELVEEIISKLTMEIEDRRVKCWRNLTIFKDIESMCKPGKYCPKDIIVDYELFYVPFYYDDFGCKNKDGGIYLRIYRMLETYKKLIKKYGNAIGINNVELGVKMWSIYFIYVLWHGVAHYIVEEVSGTFYPILKSIKEEESLAEWFAFSMTHNGMGVSNIYHFASIMYLLGNPSAELETILPIAYINTDESSITKEDILRDKVLAAIYYLKHRYKDPIYKPKIYPNVRNILGSKRFKGKWEKTVSERTLTRSRGLGIIPGGAPVYLTKY